jgi:hypothetical protein
MSLLGRSRRQPWVKRVRVHKVGPPLLGFLLEYPEIAVKLPGVFLCSSLGVRLPASGLQDEQVDGLEAKTPGMFPNVTMDEVVLAARYQVLALEDQPTLRYQDPMKFMQGQSIKGAESYHPAFDTTIPGFQVGAVPGADQERGIEHNRTETAILERQFADIRSDHPGDSGHQVKAELRPGDTLLVKTPGPEGHVRLDFSSMERDNILQNFFLRI